MSCDAKPMSLLTSSILQIGLVAIRASAPTVRRSRRAIRDILVGILKNGIDKGVLDPPKIDGRRDLKAMAMALLDQCTHVSMWYGPGGDLTEEQMAKLYTDMALRMVGAAPQTA